jgi:hypothetical protein
MGSVSVLKPGMGDRLLGPLEGADADPIGTVVLDMGHEPCIEGRLRC